MARLIPTIDLLLLCYLAHKGPIEGRTRLQKMVYFVGRRLNRNGLFKFNELSYRPHYYGPYSSEIDNDNRELKALDLVKEDQCKIKVGRKGFDLCRYDYYLTEDGKKIAKRIKNEYQDIWKEVESVIEEIKSANLNTAELSIAAKSHFIIDNHNRPITSESIQQQAKELGWDIDQKEIDKAERFLLDFGLIKLVNV